MGRQDYGMGILARKTTLWISLMGKKKAKILELI